MINFIWKSEQSKVNILIIKLGFNDALIEAN